MISQREKKTIELPVSIFGIRVAYYDVYCIFSHWNDANG
jgi:hypothetical protein